MLKLVRVLAALLVFFAGAWLMDYAFDFPPHGFFYLMVGVLALAWGGVNLVFSAAQYGGEK